MKELILKHKKIVDILIIFFVALIIGIPLFNSKLNVYYDDGVQHIARALGTLESMGENTLFPNIIFSFANNYGYSWNLFYGPLSTYGIIIVNCVLNNFVIAYKVFLFICMALSGYTMYKFISGIMQNNNIGILASVIYMSFPYHLTDMYTRNAIGEFVSFIFIPLVFWGLYNLFFTSDKHYYLAIGAIGLILTHNLSTAIISIFALVYIICNLKKLQDAKVRNGLILNIIIILLITSFYWGPFIETKLAANYQVYESGMMSTSERTASHGLNIKQLFVTMNDGSYVFELGPHIIIMLAFSVMTIRRIKKELKSPYYFFLIAGIVTLWMSTKYFPWKYLPECFSMIQFPWRMLMMSAFFLSTVCAINMYTIIKKFRFLDVAIISLISIMYIFAFYNLVTFYNDEPIANIEDFELGYISGSEYEVVAGIAKAEYLPVNAYNNRFYIATRDQSIYVLEGKAIIEEENKNLSRYTAQIQTLDAEYTIFELPYIYYPGYEVRLDGVVVDSFETENGFLGFAMGKEDKVNLEVKYSGTGAMKISLFVSMVSIMFFAIYIYKKR